MSDKKCPYDHTRLTMSNGAPVASNQDSMTAGPRGPVLTQDLWLNEKLANFVREACQVYKKRGRLKENA